MNETLQDPRICRDKACFNACISGDAPDVGANIFARGLCLPSDNKMTPDQQDVVLDIIHGCFR